MEPNVDRGMWSVVALLAAIVIGGVVLLAFPRISGKIANSMDDTVNKAFNGETPEWAVNQDSNMKRYDLYKEELNQLDNILNNSNVLNANMPIKVDYQEGKEISMKGKGGTIGIKIDIKDITTEDFFILSFKYRNNGPKLEKFGGHTDEEYRYNRVYLNGERREKVYRSGDILLSNDSGWQEVLAVFDVKSLDENSEKRLFIQPNRLAHNSPEFDLTLKDLKMVRVKDETIKGIIEGDVLKTWGVTD